MCNEFAQFFVCNCYSTLDQEAHAAKPAPRVNCPLLSREFHCRITRWLQHRVDLSVCLNQDEVLHIVKSFTDHHVTDVKFSLRTALCRGLLNGHFGPNVRLDDNTIKGRLTMVLMRLARSRARFVTDRENFLVPGLLTKHKLLSKCHDFLQHAQNHRQWKRTILWSSLSQYTNQSKGMMAWPSYLETSYATHQRPSPWKE